MAIASLKEINTELLQTERTFTTTEGLKERPWFKHQIYAPGAYTGYGVKTIPAVREALEEDKWSDAEQGAAIAGQVLMNEAKLVDSIAQQIEQMVGDSSRSFFRACRKARKIAAWRPELMLNCSYARAGNSTIRSDGSRAGGGLPLVC